MNNAIRQAAKESGVKLWQVAERYGLTDGNFSRKLRRELPEDEQRRIIGIIYEIAAEREGNHAEDAHN